MLGRFFIDAYLREQTAYAITDRAVYIARVADLPVTRRFAGSALDSVTLDSRSGAIRLAPAPPLFAPNGFAIWHGARLDVLEGLADARRVLQLVIAARDASPDRDGRRTAAT